MEYQPRIDCSKIVLIPKLSKLEYDMQTLNLTKDEVVSKYNAEGANTTTILESHELQLLNLEEVKKLLRPTVLRREEITKQALIPYSLVIAFGGDNHFQFVSHFLDDKPLLGINSDPIRSDGALVKFTLETFQDFLPSLPNASTINWTRLEVSLNGQKIDVLCLSEIYIGETARKDMSRYIIKYGVTEETHKNSGLIIATGCGSTGWYNSACRYLHPEGNIFPRTKLQAVFLATEPFNGRLSTNRMLEDYLTPGYELIIRSLNDNQGTLSIDSLHEYEFGRGSIARIRLSDKPLIVVAPE